MNTENPISPESFERIEQYLTGQLPEAEKADFERKLATDPGLQQEVETVQLLLLGIEEASLRNKLPAFHAGLPAEKKPARQSPVRHLSARRFLIAAAVLGVVLLAGWWLFLKPDQSSTLYQTYYSPDPGLMTTMGASDEYDFEKAMVDYKRGHYPLALAAWKKMEAAGQQSDTLSYFIASACLASGKTAEARTYLDKVVKQPNSSFISDAYWYIALSYIPENKKDSAVGALAHTVHPKKEALLKALTAGNK